MLDFATHDFGTYYPLCVPGPDEPVTVAWGSAIAWNLARITRGQRFQGTFTGTSSDSSGLSYSGYNCSAFPFLFFYRRSADGTFSTEDFLGSGCTPIDGGPGATNQTVSYFGSISMTTARLHVSKTGSPYTFHLMAWGR